MTASATVPSNARVIPCLDVDAGRVVKGVNFVDLTDAGDPVELAALYDQQGADEVVFLDITASSDRRETTVELVHRTAEEVFIPFTIGGGIRTVDDARRLLRAGADKVSVNTAAVSPELVAERTSSAASAASIEPAAPTGAPSPSKCSPTGSNTHRDRRHRVRGDRARGGDPAHLNGPRWRDGST